MTEQICSMIRSSVVGRAARAFGRIVACLACISVAARGRPAHAGDEAAARALFAEGRKLAASGDYAAACVKFENSYQIDPGVGTKFNLADCEEHVGRSASAWARFLEVASETGAAGQLERERVARARAAALEAELARLIVDAKTPSPGLIIEIDGQALATTSWGVARPMDPGEHLVKAAAPGRRPWALRVVVPASPDVLTAMVPPLQEIPSAAPAVWTPPPRAEPRRIPIPALVLGSVGLVAGGTAAVFGLKYLDENNRAKGLCTLPNNGCADEADASEHQRLYDAAKRDRTIYFISAGISAAALATGAYLWWRSSHRASAPSAPAVAAIAPARLGDMPALEIWVTW